MGNLKRVKHEKVKKSVDFSYLNWSFASNGYIVNLNLECKVLTVKSLLFTNFCKFDLVQLLD